jgi:hypothetical protein
MPTLFIILAHYTYLRLDSLGAGILDRDPGFRYTARSFHLRLTTTTRTQTIPAMSRSLHMYPENTIDKFSILVKSIHMNSP